MKTKVEEVTKSADFKLKQVQKDLDEKKKVSFALKLLTLRLNLPVIDPTRLSGNLLNLQNNEKEKFFDHRVIPRCNCFQVLDNISQDTVNAVWLFKISKATAFWYTLYFCELHLRCYTEVRRYRDKIISKGRSFLGTCSMYV